MAGNFVHNLTNPTATVGTTDRPWYEVRADDVYATHYHGDIEGTTGVNSETMPISYLDTDSAMAANSDTKVPSQKAVKTALNAKEPTLTKGALTEATSSVLTITGGTGAVIGAGTSIQVKQASESQDGYLSAEDYEQFSQTSDMLSWVYDLDAGEWVIDADNLNPIVCLESSGA